MSNRPVQQFKQSPIEVAIWEQDGKYGKFHNCTIQRNYKKDNAWKSTTSMRFDDLPILVSLLEQAHEWIKKQGGTGKKDAKDTATGQTRLTGMEETHEAPY